MKRILTMIIMLLLTYGLSAQEQKHVVFLKDKNNNPYTLTNPSAFLTQRSLDRRIKSAILLDIKDLPVTPSYVTQIAATGAVVVYSLKWFNAVVVNTNDPAVLSAIAALPFVDHLDQVLPKNPLQVPANSGMMHMDEIPPYTLYKPLPVNITKSTGSFNYGQAYNQVHMITLDALHNLGFSGQGMMIAVLDAGFYHVDQISAFDSLWLNNRILGTRDFNLPGNNVFGDNMHTHGTSVLSIMGGNLPGQMVGTAPNASFWLIRTETAQGIFINFDQVMTTSRKKPPFGIGQIGKSFRNEITPGNFIFRTREFEQMEMEFFVVPGTDEDWHQYWIDYRLAWYKDLGINPDRLRIYDHSKEKLSHYSKRTADIEYKFEFAGTEWGELEGIANRTDFDLKAHSAASGKDLSYFDQEKNERWTPFVIEPAAGVDRCALTFLMDAFTEDEAPNAKGEMEKRTVLKFDHRIAPVKVAVLPLSRNADLSPKARDLATALRKNWNVDFDDAGAIGRRYRRQDEIGTPYCITIDFETLDDNAVTIRDRDTMAQERISIDQVESWLAPRLLGC